MVNVMARKKVVQTELVEREYELLRRAAEERGVTIKRGLREAVHQWVRANISIGEDPLFKVKPRKTGVRTDSSRLDETLMEEVRE